MCEEGGRAGGDWQAGARGKAGVSGVGRRAWEGCANVEIWSIEWPAEPMKGLAARREMAGGKTFEPLQRKLGHLKDLSDEAARLVWPRGQPNKKGTISGCGRT